MSSANNGEGPTGWFLGKLLRHPASYVGLAAAIGMGVAAALVSMPVGGVIGLSMVVGIAAGMLSFLVGYGVKVSHRRAMDLGAAEPEEPTIDSSLRESLGEVEEAEVASVLEKMFRDRNAIARQIGETSGNEDGQRTLDLVSAICGEAANQAEELQDLARRMRDPLLRVDDEAESTMEEIRSRIESAYRAVADSRSRLRRGEKLARRDFLEPATSTSLAALTVQLAGETEIARRVEERMRPDFGNVVFSSEDDENAPAPEENSWERE